MRPQRAPTTTRSPGRVLAFAVVSLVGGLLVGAAVAALISTGRTESRLGPKVFTVGNAARLQEQVETGGPLIFPALVGERDLFVHNVSRDWFAFETTAPGADRTCQLEWRQEQFSFVDPCDGAAYPANGEGLVRYRVFVDAEGVLKVDLRRRLPLDAEATTTSSSTSISPSTSPATSVPASPPAPASTTS